MKSSSWKGVFFLSRCQANRANKTSADMPPSTPPTITGILVLDELLSCVAVGKEAVVDVKTVRYVEPSDVTIDEDVIVEIEGVGVEEVVLVLIGASV
jgi:hypothetical protein